MLEQLNADIKAALLRGDNKTVLALRFLKNSIEGVSKLKGSALSDQEVIAVLRKELKKRQESAELFAKGGNNQASAKERAEVDLIKAYLPTEMSDDDVLTRIKSLIAENNIIVSPSSMGQLMTIAKQHFGDEADPSVIARIASQLLKSGQ